MPVVRVKEGESFEQTLKRFKKQCQKAGIFSNIRRSARYEKPSVRRKRKMQAASRRLQKALRGGSPVVRRSRAHQRETEPY